MDTFKGNGGEAVSEEGMQDGLFYTVEDAHVNMIANDNSGEEFEAENPEEETEQEENEDIHPKVLRSTADELDKELSLSLLQASQENIAEEEQQKISSDIRQRIKIRTSLDNDRVRELKAYLKNKQETDNQNTQTSTLASNTPISLIINLLGRGVSVAKINQSLYIRIHTNTHIYTYP